MGKITKHIKVIKKKDKGRKSHQIKSLSSDVSKSRKRKQNSEDEDRSHKRKHISSEDGDNFSHEAYKRKHVDSDCEKSLVLLANAASRIIPDNKTDDDDDDDCEKEAVFSADDDSSVESAPSSEFPSFLQNLELSYEEQFRVSPKPKKTKRKQTVQDLLKSIEMKSDISDSDSDDKALFYAKRYESNGVSEADNKSKESVRVQCVPLRNLEVVLLEHPASVAIYNYISVSVLSGTVSILGYHIDEKSSPIRVLSSKSTGVLRLKTESTSEIWKKDKYKEIKHHLKRLTFSETIPLRILNKCKDNTVIVVLQACIPPPSLKFINLYYPNLLKFPKIERLDRFASNTDFGIKFTSLVSGLAEEIITFVRRSEVNSEPGPRVLVYGNSNAGKSTLLKYLVNRVLSSSDVIYFESDPGQCEFTPPGAISFTKVSQPIIGPPFSHPRKPVKMVFTGSITPATSPEMYIKSIKSLMKHYKTHRYMEPMFVNTVGWVQGLGIEILGQVVKAIEPTILVEIMDETSVMCDYRQFVDTTVKYYQIPKQLHNRKFILAKDYRHLSVLAYMGKCQSPYAGPVYLNEVKPYCISWDKIPVYVFNRRVAPNRLIEAINGSVVALCRVLETSILESDVPEYTKTLEKDPENNCLGFGIVRAVDEEMHLLYIVTPLSIEELQFVNAIMKGDILTPPMIFTKQPITGQPLPFINKSKSSES